MAAILCILFAVILSGLTPLVFEASDQLIPVVFEADKTLSAYLTTASSTIYASYFKFKNHTYNSDDFAFATQVLIWKFQQQLRTDTTRGSSTLKTNATGTPKAIFYDQIKGRPAEDCYNYILTEMAKYQTIEWSQFD